MWTKKQGTRFTLDPCLSLEQIAERIPFTYSGADIYALCADAMLKAVTRQISTVESKIRGMVGEHSSTAFYLDNLATEQDTMITVIEDDFVSAQRELVGSVR